MSNLALKESETTDAALENYQWAWEFTRRGDDYSDFYPPCKKAFGESLGEIDPKNRSGLEALGCGPNFKNSPYYDRLHNEFGLNMPVHPETPGADVTMLIWDFSFYLQGIIVADKNLDEKLQIPVVLDLRLPREYQIEALDHYLRDKGCAEAVKKRQPGKFQEYLDCYDTRKRLRELSGREPTNLEIALQIWPNLQNISVITEKELADKVRYPLKMADHYINNKGYFEILRWKPPAKK